MNNIQKICIKIEGFYTENVNNIICLCSFNRIEQVPSKDKAAGSSPARGAILITYYVCIKYKINE